jgi:hypothetical protein
VEYDINKIRKIREAMKMGAVNVSPLRSGFKDGTRSVNTGNPARTHSPL